MWWDWKESSELLLENEAFIPTNYYSPLDQLTAAFEEKASGLVDLRNTQHQDIGHTHVLF